MSAPLSNRRLRNKVHAELAALLDGGQLAVPPPAVRDYLSDRRLLTAVAKQYRAQHPDAPTAGRAAIITAGVPGAGKTSALSAIATGYRRIDPDEIKDILLARPPRRVCSTSASPTYWTPALPKGSMNTTLFAPKVRYASTFESRFDAMTTWRAELEMTYLLDESDPQDVLVGSADFLTIRVGEHPIDDLLDSLSDDVEHLAGLFDGDDVEATVQEQFDDAPFNRILIITDVTLAAPIRRHSLGPWLVAEIVAKMSSPIDTLVLLHPHLGSVGIGDAVGLVPIAGHPECLGQATAYRYLSDARAALSTLADVQVTVPASQIDSEPPNPYPRHAIVAEPVPQHLRVVRDPHQP